MENTFVLNLNIIVENSVVCFVAFLFSFTILKRCWTKISTTKNLLPFLIECYKVDKRSIECFIFGQFQDIFCNNYTGQKLSVPLSEQIKYRTYLKKINDSDKYFLFFY